MLEDVEALKSAGGSLGGWTATVRSRQKTTQRMLRASLPLFFCAPQGIVDTQERAEMALRLTQVALALNAHRTEQGDYPETLEALTPGYIEAIPADLFTGQSPRYSRVPGGFTIISPGPNGRTEDGASPNGMPADGSDDLVVRIPSPREHDVGVSTAPLSGPPEP